MANTSKAEQTLLKQDWQDEKRTKYSWLIGGVCVGQFTTYHDEPEQGVLYFEEFVIGGQHRRKGYGIKMLKALIALAKRKGYKKLALWAWKTNDIAITMYKKAGFQEAEFKSVRLPDIYGEKYIGKYKTFMLDIE